MKKLHLAAFFLIALAVFSCKKKEIDTSDTSKLDNCDPKRKTILVATEWIGTLGYDNEMRKWTVNTQIQGTYDGMRTALICVDIPDDFKRLNNLVIFSGELKESNGTPAPKLGGQEIYYINPTKLELKK